MGMLVGALPFASRLLENISADWGIEKRQRATKGYIERVMGNDGIEDTEVDSRRCEAAGGFRTSSVLVYTLHVRAPRE